MSGFGGTPGVGSSEPGSGGLGGGSIFDWTQLGLGVLGGALGSANNQKMSAAEIAERQREFDKAFGITSGNAAVGAQKQLDTAPLRDRVMYQLQQLLTQTPQQFKPHDMFNGGGVAQQGGYDMAKQATANEAYRPGAGGVNTDVLKKFLASIGYAPPPLVRPGLPGGAQPLTTPPKRRIPVNPTPLGVTL